MVMDFKSYFSGLKKTVEGKDNYYFLVNDSNDEIRQHYDDTYQLNFDLNSFIYSFLSKKSYLDAMDINYDFFIVPDKSVSMRKYLPFDAGTPRRITDWISDYVYDLLDVIGEGDVLKNDTHVTPLSSLKIVPYVISKMHNQSSQVISDKLRLLLKEEIHDHKGDLFFDVNWSYPKDERFIRNAHVDVPVLVLKDDFVEVDLKDIPEKFRKVSSRKSFYYINPNSISDRKALIIRDSSTNMLMHTFMAYYREVFFYWDQWYFNKDLVEWFKPDDVIEIRTERFLNNALYPTLDNDFIIRQRVIFNDELFEYDDERISWKFNLMNSYNQLLDTSVDVYIDDDFVKGIVVKEGIFSFEYVFEEVPLGIHSVKIIVKSTESSEETIVSNDFLINPKIDLSNLKSTLKGMDNTYFLVNDSNHELLQHYYYDYHSRFNLHDFKLSLDSKRKFFNNRNIIFTQFIIPDKSVLLMDLLPFKAEVALRHMDELTNYYYDLSRVLKKEDYIPNDTKISDSAALRCVLFMVSKLYPDRNTFQVEEQLLERLYYKQEEHPGDLFHRNSWSYEFDEEYENNRNVMVKSLDYIDYDAVEELEIPGEFTVFNKTESLYYRNENPIEDKKVLIITDKAINPFIKIFVSFFGEVFFYHDYWYFNYDLIDWLKPDIVLEIRSERTLDNALTNRISDDMKTIIPITVKMDSLEVNDNILHIKAYCEDLRKLPLNVSYKIFIDDEMVLEDVLHEGYLEVNHSINHYELGSHVLKIRIDEGHDTKAKLITQNFEVK